MWYSSFCHFCFFRRLRNSVRNGIVHTISMKHRLSQLPIFAFFTCIFRFPPVIDAGPVFLQFPIQTRKRQYPFVWIPVFTVYQICRLWQEFRRFPLPARSSAGPRVRSCSGPTDGSNTAGAFLILLLISGLRAERADRKFFLFPGILCGKNLKKWSNNLPLQYIISVC